MAGIYRAIAFILVSSYWLALFEAAILEPSSYALGRIFPLFAGLFPLDVFFVAFSVVLHDLEQRAPLASVGTASIFSPLGALDELPRHV